MCDLHCDRPQLHTEEHRTARKTHTCYACDEPIRPGQQYVATRQLYDGYWSSWKRCLRCEAMADAIRVEFDEPVGLDPELNCGETWQSVFGEEPPEHVAALAFWLPGEPLPGPRGTGR